MTVFLTVNLGNVIYCIHPRIHYTSRNYFKGVLVRVTVTVWWRHTAWNNLPVGFTAMRAAFRWSSSSESLGTVPLGSYSRRMAANVVSRDILPLPCKLPLFVRVHSTQIRNWRQLGEIFWYRLASLNGNYGEEAKCTRDPTWQERNNPPPLSGNPAFVNLLP